MEGKVPVTEPHPGPKSHTEDKLAFVFFFSPVLYKMTGHCKKMSSWGGAANVAAS